MLFQEVVIGGVLQINIQNKPQRSLPGLAKIESLNVMLCKLLNLKGCQSSSLTSQYRHVDVVGRPLDQPIVC